MKKLMEYLEEVHEERDGKWGTWIGLSEVQALPAVKRIEKFGYNVESSDTQLKKGTLIFANSTSRSQRNTRFEVTANGFVRRRYTQGSARTLASGRKIPESTQAGAIGQKESWYNKPVESIETLEKMLDFLASYIERNPRWQSEEGKKEDANHQEMLRQQRREKEQRRMEKMHGGR